MYDRCISRGVTAGFFPSIYGNGSEFVQTPDMMAIRYEMIHETRLIPLDNRPRNSSKMRSYMGEPRGHWEGDTLVVETKNFIGGNWPSAAPRTVKTLCWWNVSAEVVHRPWNIR